MAHKKLLSLLVIIASLKKLLSLLVIIASVFSFLGILGSDLGGVAKFILCIALFIATGMALKSLLKLHGEWGIIMLKDRRGLELLDRIARSHPKFWALFADFGLAFGFGLLSVPLLKGKPLQYKAKLLAASTLALILFSVFVSPAIFSVLASQLTSIDITSATQQARGVFGPNQLVAMAASLLILVLGGIALTTATGVISYAAIILSNIAHFMLGNSAPLAGTQPGAALIIPGINLPLFEGVLALAILLVVHESSHGILARIAKIRLDSAGVVLFGILPAGAFIDPDEKQLARAKHIDQHRVLVAGSTANFATSLLAFFLLISFAFLTYNVRDSGMLVTSGTSIIPQGTLIKTINGKDALTFTGEKFKPGSTVKIESNKGTYDAIANKDGKIGAYLDPVSKNSAFGRMRFLSGFEWLAFIYTTLALTFALNFIVGAVNLLPVPMFDGYRVMDISVQSPLLKKAITGIILLSFVTNFLPWFVR
jgi:Zn-dependent protease